MPVVALGACVSCMWTSVESLCFVRLGSVPPMEVYCELTTATAAAKSRKVRVIGIGCTQDLTARRLAELGCDHMLACTLSNLTNIHVICDLEFKRSLQ